jgi:Polyphosphate kinase 2 (PPK2)
LHEVDDTMALKRAADIAKPKMKRKASEKELRKLQVELCHLQDWVKQTGARIIIVFEGRDAAGKGGTIKAPRRYCFGLRIPKGSPPIGRATGKMPAAGLGLRSKRSPTMDRRRRSSNASTACWRTPLATTGMVHGASTKNNGVGVPTPRKTACLDPGTRPELHLPNVAAQRRVVSVARIRLDPRKSVRSFKGIICDNISEFESYMPSQPVRSLQRTN